MRIRGKHGDRLIDAEVRSFVLYDDLGTPLVLGIQTGPKTQVIATANDADFNTILEQYGFTRRVLVTDVQGNPLSNIRWD